MFSLFPPRWYSAESCIKDAAASWLNARPDGHRTLPSVSVPPIPSALHPCRQVKGLVFTQHADWPHVWTGPLRSRVLPSQLTHAFTARLVTLALTSWCLTNALPSERSEVIETHTYPPKGFRAFVPQVNTDNISQKSCHTLQFLLKKNIPMAVLEYIFFFLSRPWFGTADKM